MRLTVLAPFALSFLAAASLAASSRDQEILAEAQLAQFDFRSGNYAAATPLVQKLEVAVAESTNNAKLWEALGNAYMSQQGATLTAQPDMPKVIAIGERARDAYARSLALAPDNMLVRASHGMAQMVTALLKGDGPGITAGVDEMNAAARQAPQTIGVRLTRAFTIIHLPPAMRDTDAVIGDLEYIMRAAPGGRPEDVLRLMLGDVHAEMGNLKTAREEYLQVSGASAFALDQVKSRLADLEKGAVSPASIAQVRAGTGSGCAMCHAPGSDKPEAGK
ncbi:MAG: hypothetical protein K0Q43_5384 [Ramlibacter sp.]|nr:hypothetical protein [Ramlibacter sp.]